MGIQLYGETTYETQVLAGQIGISYSFLTRKRVKGDSTIKGSFEITSPVPLRFNNL